MLEHEHIYVGERAGCGRVRAGNGRFVRIGSVRVGPTQGGQLMHACGAHRLVHVCRACVRGR